MYGSCTSPSTWNSFALGYDLNTIEFAVRDGVPIAIDFMNPAPDCDLFSVGQENFDWVVETAADYAIERAKKQKDGMDNLTWGEYIKTAAANQPLLEHEKKVEKKAGKKEAATGKIDHEILAEGTIKNNVPKKAAVKAPAKPKAPAKK